jgi:hypothetical protein
VAKETLSKFLFFELMQLQEKCNLGAALLWVHCQLPPTEYAHWYSDGFVLEQEYARIGISGPPNGQHYRTPEVVRKNYRNARAEAFKDMLEEAERNQTEFEKWRIELERATELAAARIFVELGGEKLVATGKLLPHDASAHEFIADQRSYDGGDERFDELLDQVIPKNVWSQRGIDWLSSAVANGSDCYCDITVPVSSLMSVFPVQCTPLSDPVYEVGEFLMIDGENYGLGHKGKSRGRPSPFAWDAFHVEVAMLIKRGRFPDQREAAIWHMQEWFSRTYKQTPSRTVIGDRLTPYFRALQKESNSVGN